MPEIDSLERVKRWQIYKLLILATLTLAAGRIAVVASPQGDTAFLSANDRSRWANVASLVEHGTYQIDQPIAITDPIHRHLHPWQSIDKVQHRGDDGRLHYFSSKPPLLTTLVAGLYWCVHVTTGMTMTAQPVYVPRILLAMVNLPLLAVFLWSTISVIDKICRSQWGRFSGVLAVCFGTMLLPFSISLSNHLPAATAMAIVMAIYFYAAESRDQGGLDADRPGTKATINSWLYLIVGISVAMAAANELPALSMTVFWVGLFWWLDRTSVLPIIAGIGLVAIAFFATNWTAHQSLRPPYAHRGNGSIVQEFKKSASETKPQESKALKQEIRMALASQYDLADDHTIEVLQSDEPGRWRVMAGNQDFALLALPDAWRLHEWDDWYEYPNSYWQDGNRVGVDLGEPSRWIYLFHLTLGHHGIFSLTPLFLLIPFGMIRMLRFGPDDSKRFVAAVLVASIVCVAFYVMRPLIDRNYGGVSCCFRWLLWFTPLWLVMVAVALDAWSHSRWWRRFAASLLALSVFSMTTAMSSPWESPWLYRYWHFLGWLGN